MKGERFKCKDFNTFKNFYYNLKKEFDYSMYLSEAEKYIVFDVHNKFHYYITTFICEYEDELESFNLIFKVNQKSFRSVQGFSTTYIDSKEIQYYNKLTNKIIKVYNKTIDRNTGELKNTK